MSVNFVETTLGLAKATIAGTTGPKISFATFKLGNAFGYSPTAADTGLNGSTVYTDDILTATPYSSDTMDVVIQIPASAGPFNFGEIGLYLDDGTTMFAKCAYPTLQTKLSDTVDGVGAIFTIHCLIKLTSLTASFDYTINNIASIPIFAGSALVGPNAVGATVNAVIATDYTPDMSGPYDYPSPILCLRQSNTHWDFAGYVKVMTFVATSTTTTSGNCNLLTRAKSGTDFIRKGYIIESPAGEMVVVDTVDPSTGDFTLTRAVSWLNNTDTYTLFVCDALAPYTYAGYNAPLPNGVAAVGTANRWAREDHVHDTDTSYFGISLPLMDGVASPGSSTLYLSRHDHRHPSDTSRAPVNSPNLTGSPTTPTPIVAGSPVSQNIANVQAIYNLLSIDDWTNVQGSPTAFHIGGLFIKTGVIASSSGPGGDVVNFFNPFPHSIIGVWPVDQTGGVSNTNLSTNIPTTSSVTIYTQSSGHRIMWMALGS